MKHAKSTVRRTVLIIAALVLLIGIGLAVLFYLEPWVDGVHRERLPVLMYHHFEETSDNGTVVSASRFREQITALHDAGYHSVTVDQVVDFVENGTPLPDKPVLITMDDGYTSNVTVAAPILEEFGFCATVFVIGIYEGETVDPHNGWPIFIPRFAYEEALPWVEKGVLELQYHSYDMHQLIADGFSERDGMLRLSEESEEGYASALRADLEAFTASRKEHRLTKPVTALAYPYGYYDDASEQPLRDLGILATFTVEEHSNILVVGDPDSLWDLGRYNVYDAYTGEMLLARLAVRW